MHEQRNAAEDEREGNIDIASDASFDFLNRVMRTSVFSIKFLIDESKNILSHVCLFHKHFCLKEYAVFKSSEQLRYFPLNRCIYALIYF